MTSPHTRRPDALWTVVLGIGLALTFGIFGIGCAVLALSGVVG